MGHPWHSNENKIFETIGGGNRVRIGVLFLCVHTVTFRQIAAPVGRHDDAAVPKAVEGKPNADVAGKVGIDIIDDPSKWANKNGTSFNDICVGYTK